MFVYYIHHIYGFRVVFGDSIVEVLRNTGSALVAHEAKTS